MIEKLTPEQIAKFPEYVEKWTRIGLSCEPANVAECRRGIDLAYTAARLSPPQHIIVCDGPLAAAVVATIFKNQLPPLMTASVRARVRASVADSVWDSVSASVSDSVSDSVWDSVAASVWANVADSVADSVRDNVAASVRDSVAASVWANVAASVRASVSASVAASVAASVWDSVTASVWDSVAASVRKMLYASHAANASSWWAFWRDECGLKKQVEPATGLIIISENCGWWAPYKNMAIIQHRHSECHRNERGRLHNEKGMAVKYRDGWGLYAIDGITVDEQIVLRPESQTIVQIDGEKNNDIKTIRINRFGWTRYLRESGAKCIDTRKNEIEGTQEALYRTKDGEQRLVAVCPTGRIFALGVPGDVKTCDQAQHYLAGGKNFWVLART